MPEGDAVRCQDCGSVISLCDHALQRALDPLLSYHAGEAEDLRAENARIRAVGDDLAYWLRAWVNGHPGQQWCYSEAALARWRALGGNLSGSAGEG